MKIQDWLFRLEEVKALVSLYEELVGNLASATTLLEAGELTEEQVAQLTEVVEAARRRYEKVCYLISVRTGTDDVEQAIEVVEEQQGWFEQYQQLRRQQVQLKLSLELAQEVGELTPDQRKQGLGMQEVVQQRMGALLELARRAYPATRLVLA